MSTKSRSTKVQMFRARQRKGDVENIAYMTGFSPAHVSNVLANRRNDSYPSIVETAYKLSYRRKPNSQLTNA